VAGVIEIHETEYGIRIVTNGLLSKEDLKRMGREAGQIVPRLRKGFGVLHEMRGMFTLPPDAREVMKRNMEVAKQSGMGRSAQILDNAVVTLQFSRLAKEIGISDTMRQFDSSKAPDCERAAIDWIVKGIDPYE
jgi:hypothetical protein